MRVRKPIFIRFGMEDGTHLLRNIFRNNIDEKLTIFSVVRKTESDNDLTCVCGKRVGHISVIILILIIKTYLMEGRVIIIIIIIIVIIVIIIIIINIVTDTQ